MSEHVRPIKAAAEPRRRGGVQAGFEQHATGIGPGALHLLASPELAVEDLRGTVKGRTPELRPGGVEERIAFRNSRILSEGDARGEPRQIRSGWALRYKTTIGGRRQVVGILLPGDVFGLELQAGLTPAYSVVSASTVVYVPFPASHSTAALLHAAFHEREMADNLLVLLGQCSSEERTAAFLVWLYGRLETCGLARDNIFELEMTQQDISDYLGINPIHLNRVMGRLRARGLIAVQGRRVTLADMDRLRGMTPGL